MLIIVYFKGTFGLSIWLKKIYFVPKSKDFLLFERYGRKEVLCCVAGQNAWCI